eukprot:686290-Hanusia_phi.AAC.1
MSYFSSHIDSDITNTDIMPESYAMAYHKALLGLNIKQSYTKQEINAAWKKRMLACHPDKTGHHSSDNADIQELHSAKGYLLEGQNDLWLTSNVDYKK